MIVVDASLAAKWILWEADSEAALRFLRRHAGDLAAPDLIRIEVASAVVRRGNQDKAWRGEALAALEKWVAPGSRQGLRTFGVTERRLLNAASIALTIGHPLKDCLYVALALELDSDLITCDVKLRDKAASLHSRVRLLSDYSAG